MEDIGAIIRRHPFFAGFAEPFLDLISGCGRNVVFPAGSYLFHEGDAADQFYLIRHGRVALEVAVPGAAPLILQTLSEGEIVGVSWLIPPYRWSFDARAMELVRAVALDAVCLRRKCDENHDLGYSMMQRFMPVLIKRLQATRLQLLDVYGHHG
jgi:CRP/FNR family cyclic AMP-dependent transcriptional regulator